MKPSDTQANVPAEPPRRGNSLFLEDEAAVPTLSIVARGERAKFDEIFQKIHDGVLPIKTIEAIDKWSVPLPGFSGEDADGADEKTPPAVTEKWYAPERVNSYRARLLRYMTDFVEIGKRPDQEQPEALAQLEATLRDCPIRGLEGGVSPPLPVESRCRGGVSPPLWDSL